MALLHSLYNTLKPTSLPALINQLIFSAPPLEPIPKTSLQSLPNEIILEIFSFLELKPYILCHGVCKEWRHLLPLTNLHPVRKRLLDLYHLILDTPDFAKAFDWTNQNIEPFDREAYVNCLLRQYPAIPEEYRMWILEWPSLLLIQSTWPGLPFTECETLLSIHRRSGVNWIAYRPFSPQLSALVYKLDTPSQMFIPGLFIWHDETRTDWLVFGQDEPDLFGRVFLVDTDYHTTGSIPYYPPRQRVVNEQKADEDTDINAASISTEHRDEGIDEDSEDETEYSEGEEELVVFDDWISYLENLWSGTIARILRPGKTYIVPDRLVPQPVPYAFADDMTGTLFAHAWQSSQRTILRPPVIPIEWTVDDEALLYEALWSFASD